MKRSIVNQKLWKSLQPRLPAVPAGDGCATGSRRLGSAAPSVADAVASMRSDRLEPCQYRWGKLDSKRHIIVDQRGVPLALSITGANRHDRCAFEVLVDAIPAVLGLPARPRQRPHKLHADKGYDFRCCREHLQHRGIMVRITRRGVVKQRETEPTSLKYYARHYVSIILC